MSKTTSQIKPREESSKISVCDVMKGNTTKIIKKMESQIPIYLQLYSDYYKEYLHSMEDLYGTCYLSEKEFFDNIGIDQNALKIFDQYATFLTNIGSSQIEMSTNLLRAYFQMRILGIKSYDAFMHSMMESYAKLLPNFNKIFKK